MTSRALIPPTLIMVPATSSSHVPSSAQDISPSPTATPFLCDEDGEGGRASSGSRIYTEKSREGSCINSGLNIQNVRSIATLVTR